MMRGLSLDNTRTDMELLKTVPICLLDRNCPCEIALIKWLEMCMENGMLMHAN